MRSGGHIDYILQRRAVVCRGGDIIELFSLSVRNVGDVPYSFVENDNWIWFGITDSAAECVGVYDSAEPGGWHKEQKRLEFVVGKLPQTEIDVGGERVFGARLFRRARVGASDQEVHFDDPLLLESLEHLSGSCASYRATIIFPERHDGWEITAPDASRITSRAASWESVHDGSPLRHLRATARAPAKNAAALLYDDIVAELEVLLGRELCAEAVDLSDLSSKVKLAEHEFVREIVAPLKSVESLTGVARRSQMARVLETMTKTRETFLRVSANSRHSTTVTTPSPVASPALDASSAPVSIFISYSTEDDELRRELEAHLAPMERQSVIRPWSSHRVTPGRNREAITLERLRGADVILLLLSASFFASDYCWSQEMSLALERHRRGEARVVPILLRACDYRSTPIAELKLLPDFAGAPEPVASCRDRDAAFTNVVHGIQAAIAELR